MRNSFKYAFIFAIGAAAGSGITWLFTKRYYKNIADEEIESVKLVYAKHFGERNETESENSPVEKIEETNEEDDHTEDYKKVLSKEGYTNYSKRLDNKEHELPSEDDNPFVCFINDDEYGFEFETESLDYFAGDDILINELGEPMGPEDISEAIGVDWKDKLLNCGYERLYIRNTFSEIDYEVVLNSCNYYDKE